MLETIQHDERPDEVDVRGERRATAEPALEDSRQTSYPTDFLLDDPAGELGCELLELRGLFDAERWPGPVE